MNSRDKIPRSAFSDYLNNFDLTIRKSTVSIFGGSKIKNVIETDDRIISLDSKFDIDAYLKILTEENVRPYFISETNFIFNQANSRMSTTDFRVLINDFTDTVPKYVLMHIGSICIMMLSDKISRVIGNQRIKDVLEAYGTVSFVSIAHDCIHLNVHSSNFFKKFSFRKGGNLVQKSK